jgi:hypothetical protein
MSSAEVRITPMERYEAEQKTGRIRMNFDENYRLIKEMRDRLGWKVLGFESFEVWSERSFGQTPGRISQLLTAARIAEHIEAGTFTRVNVEPTTTPDEYTLRPMARLLNERIGFGEWGERADAHEKINEAWGQAVERSNGKPTARDVQAAVDEVLERRPADDRAAKAHEQWSKFLYDISGYYIKIQSIGGIGRLARDWDEGRKCGYRDHLRETGDLFHRIAQEIEESL